MTKRVLFSLFATFVLGIADAQTYSNSTLNAKYFFRELFFITDATGNPTDVRSASGTVSFDGQGGYSVTAVQNIGIGNSSALSVTGTYAMASNAAFTLTDPLKTSLTLNARYTGEAVFGSSSDATDNTFSFFIAVPQSTGGFSVKTLTSPYLVSTMELTGAGAASARGAMFTIQPDSKGAIPAFSIRGHAANVNNGYPKTSSSNGAAYAVNADGSGSINFGSVDPTQFISGTKPIFISKDATIFIGGSTDPGVQDMLIGVKSVATAPAPTDAAWAGGYFTAGLRMDAVGQTSASYTGALNSNGAAVTLFTRRTRQAGVPATFSFTGSLNYTVNADATVSAGDYSFGLGATGLVQAEASQLEYTAYEIGFGVPYPAFSGSGVFINPYGIVNAASNSPGGAAISPGEFLTIFGSNLAGQTTQAGAPYPLALGGVTVAVNGIPAPIYLVSSGQISFLVPYAAIGATAAIVVKNSVGTSNTVTLPLATTSPGIYSVDLTGAGAGVAQHADYSYVTSANPARRGETIILYATGLGAVSPKVADGVAAPSNPTSNVTLTAQQLNVYVGGVAAAVPFAGLAPGYPGLYQLNVTIPKNIIVLGQVPIAINTPDSYHDQVSICVECAQ